MLKKVIFPSTLFTLLLTPCVGNSDPSNDWLYNPFSKDSAHHRPIGENAEYVSEDHPVTQAWLDRSHRFAANHGYPFSVNIHRSDENDTLFTVEPDGGPHGDINLPVDLYTNPSDVDGLVFEQKLSADRLVVIYDEFHDAFFEFRLFNWNDGEPVSRGHWLVDHRGLGHAADPNDPRAFYGAMRASNAFGLIRGWEMNPSGHPINHALAMALTRVGDCTHILGEDFIWPASGRDGGWSDSDKNLGPAPYGGLFAIPPESKGGPNLDDLGLTKSGRRIAQAMRDYGIYAKEGIGCNRPPLYFDQEVDPDIVRDFTGGNDPDSGDGAKLFPHLRMVTNNDPAFSTAGGGTPLAPNTAIDNNGATVTLLPPSRPEPIQTSNN